MNGKRHAVASPSHAATWLACPNSLAAEIGQPEGDTSAADLGTAKHEVLNMCLEDNCDASHYLGGTCGDIPIDQEFADHVQNVIDRVRDRIHSYELLGCQVTVELEQSLPIDHITGEQGATGTGDVVLLVLWPDRHASVDVIDAKFGYSEVLAEENPQLKMYASGALEKFGLVYDFTEVTLVIEQPLRGSSEWTTTPAAIREFELRALGAAGKALTEWSQKEMWSDYILDAGNFNVTEEGCQWCKASAVCPARMNHVEEQMEAGFSDAPLAVKGVEFVSIERLGEVFPHLETIEDWIKAVRTRIDYHWENGTPVPGTKLVMGKKGNRQWSSDEEAETLMKKFRLKTDEMYSKKLLGPAKILPMLKDQPVRYKQIEMLVVQPEGKPHVALDTDKRPALEIKPVDDGFELC